MTDDTNTKTCTEDEWNSMSWPDRFNKAKEVLGLHTHAELARYLHVSLEAVKSWMRGINTPRKATQDAVRYACMESCKKDEIAKAISSIASVSVDDTIRSIKSAVPSGDKVASLTTTAMTGVKIMFSLREVFKLPVTASMAVNYDSTPESTVITMLYPADRAFECTISLEKSASAHDDFVAKMQVKRFGKVEQAFAYVLNDKAVADIASKLYKYFSLKYNLNI